MVWAFSTGLEPVTATSAPTGGRSHVRVRLKFAGSRPLDAPACLTLTGFGDASSVDWGKCSDPL